MCLLCLLIIVFQVFVGFVWFFNELGLPKKLPTVRKEGLKITERSEFSYIGLGIFFVFFFQENV